MKKYSWIVALLMALALVFMMGCPDGDSSKKKGGDGGDDGDFVQAEDIAVEFAADKVAVLASGGATIEYVAGGYKVTYGSQGHGNVKAYFKVDLGAASVKSFDKATFDFTAGGGDVLLESNNDGPKSLNLLASNTETDMSGYSADGPLMNLIVNSVAAGIAGGDTINKSGVKVAPDGAKELAIEAGRPKSSSSGEVWFSVYLHSEPSAGGAKSAFTITNFKLIARVGEATDAVVNIAAIPGVTAPVADATPKTAITATSQYTGTIAWADAAGTALTGTFEEDGVYTATITLTALDGYTFDGVIANFFTVAGADAVSNAAGAGKTMVVTATFPAAPVKAFNFGVIVDGTEQRVEIATVGATADYIIDGSGYTVTDINYGNAYAYFQVDLGTDTLSDYTQLAYKWIGKAGDVGWKSVHLIASDTEFTDPVLSTSALDSNSFQQNNLTETVGHFYFLSSSTESKPYIAIVMWGGAGTAPAKTEYEVYDIELIKGTKYTVTLDPNGGTVDPEEITLVDGQTVRVGTLPTPTLAGNAFLGWEKSDGTIVALGDVIDEDFEDETLTAQWIAQLPMADINVSFTANDTTTGFVLIGDGEVTAVTATGYTFEQQDSYGPFVLFKLTIPTSTGGSTGDGRLGYYDKVTFTFTGVSGDAGYKSVEFRATDSASGTPAAYHVSAPGTGVGPTGTAELTINIDKGKALDELDASEIWVGFYIHAAQQAGDPPAGDNTTYTISNIKFIQE